MGGREWSSNTRRGRWYVDRKVLDRTAQDFVTLYHIPSISACLPIEVMSSIFFESFGAFADFGFIHQRWRRNITEIIRSAK